MIPPALTPPPEVSPAPWPLLLVMLTGVFSATAWGLGTLFRPRPRFARAPEDFDDDGPADDEAPDDEAPHDEAPHDEAPHDRR